MDKQQKAYCRAVRRALRCPARERKALLDRLAADMAGQFGPQASPTRRELVEAFGPPETLAAEYMESMDAQKNADYEAARRRNTKLLIGLLTLLIIFAAGSALYQYFKLTFRQLPVVEKETTIIILPPTSEKTEDMSESEYRVWMEAYKQENGINS